MKIKCEFCREEFEDYEEKCPHCGAPNNYKVNIVENNTSIINPKTIEELKQWYIEHNLPDEEITRFFIGKNYQSPKAFGIYKDLETGNFVVYKNKADGTRAIRYSGTDEEYAVNELYLKLKEEIANQKNNNNNFSDLNSKTFLRNVGIFIIIGCLIVGGMSWFLGSLSPKRGYYNYNNDYYYYQGYDWYEYDKNAREWKPTTASDELKNNYSSYYDSTDYDSGYDIDDFKDSEYWDSSSSWDSSDSWDSGSTDWSSDW